MVKWITFGLKFLSSYKTTTEFDLSNLKRPEEYCDLKEFYEDVDNLTYKIEFLNIKEEYVDALVEKGQLYLFEIRNKDFAKMQVALLIYILSILKVFSIRKI